MIHGLIPTLAEGGKIKVGKLGETRKSKSGGTYRMPVKLDHFLVTKTTRDENGDLELDTAVMAALKKDADGQVRSIPIILHADDIEAVFPSTYAMYEGRRLSCRGDGQEATRWELGKDGRRTGKSAQIPCPCAFLESGKCKPHGTLHCSIAIPGVAVAGSVHKWRTTSIISVQRMIGSLQQILSLCGTLRGVPLWLRVEPLTVTPKGAPPSTVYCCHIELRAKDILAVQRKALQAAQMRRALGAGTDEAYKLIVAPPAGDQESVEEQDEVSQEFHPEHEADWKPVVEEPKRKSAPKDPVPKAEKKKAPTQDADRQDDEPQASTMPNPYSGVLDSMEKRSPKGKKSFFVVKLQDGQEFTTFSDTVIEDCKAIGKGTAIFVHWKASGKYRNIESVEAAIPGDAGGDSDKEAEAANNLFDKQR